MPVLIINPHAGGSMTHAENYHLARVLPPFESISVIHCRIRT